MISVSFIIPSYNDEAYVTACLESVSALKGEDYEFIVVDDGSTDGTGGICDRFSRQDRRFKVIHQPNKGVSEARNAGIDAASGKWLFFIDGDDYIYPDQIETSILPELDDSCDVIFFLYDEDIQGKLGKSDPFAVKRTVMDTPEQVEALRCAVWNRYYEKLKAWTGAGVNIASPWGKVYRTEFIKENGLRFVPGIIRAQDQLFNAHVYLCVKRAMLLPVTGYVYRGRAGKSYPYRKELEENDRLLLQEHEKYLKRCGSGLVEYHYQVWLCAHVMFMLRLDYCNPNNPGSYRDRKDAFRRYVSRPAIQEAFRKVDLNDAGTSRKIVLRLVKRRWFLPLNIYYRSYRFASFFAGLRKKLDR